MPNFVNWNGLVDNHSMDEKTKESKLTQKAWKELNDGNDNHTYALQLSASLVRMRSSDVVFSS